MGLKQLLHLRERKRAMEQQEIKRMLDAGLLEWKRTRRGWVLKQKRLISGTMIFAAGLLAAGIGLLVTGIHTIAGGILVAAGAFTMIMDAIYD